MQKIPSLKICKAKTDRAEKQNKQFTVIGGDFNTPLSVIDRNARQKISKDIKLNSTINQQDLIDMHRTLHPTTAEHTYFSSTRGIFIKIDHIPSH